MKHNLINCSTRFYATFCAMLLATISLYSMSGRYSIIPELIAHSAISIPHNTICALALVNTNLNTIARFTAEQRKKYLEPYVQKQLHLMLPIAWHVLGSACAFLNLDLKPQIPHQYYVNFCRLQLADNNVTGGPIISTKVDRITKCYTIYRQKNKYHVNAPNGTYDTKILFPTFDAQGNASIYHYSLSSTDDTTFTEISINSYGAASTSPCMFEYGGKKNSLKLLMNTPFFYAFINSHNMQKNDGVKTFMSNGVTINGAPLTVQQMDEINLIIESHKKMLK